MLDMLFLFCAIAGGAILLIQFGLTLLGLGDDVDGDLDGDFDADADGDLDHVDSSWFFQVISLKGLIAAAAFFGLGGLWARASEMSPGSSITLGVLLGLAAMYGVYWMMKQLYKLRSSGTVNIKNAPGREATIYIPVPASGEGKGKIQMQLQGRTYEFEAVTDDAEKLATGESVLVTEVLGSDLVRVARVKEEAPAAV